MWLTNFPKCTRSSTWFLGPMWVTDHNDISISSAVFARITVIVTNRQTHTDHAAPSAAIHCIYQQLMAWCNLTITTITILNQCRYSQCYHHGYSHCQCLSSSCEEHKLSTKWLPALTSTYLSAATVHIHLHHLQLLLSLKADTHFTAPWRVQNHVYVGTAVRTCCLRQKQLCCDKH